jgi:ribosomal protein S18 acetylase RimI-like enzyme
MDRDISRELSDIRPVEGYELADALTAAKGTWSELFNQTFADHWRFAPRAEEEILADKSPELCLMAVSAGSRAPAAIGIGELAQYDGDRRPQPLGLISSVGTLPGHRRRGLATWLVRELVRRLRAAGASHASLYVDGWNPMHADETYRKLGFEVTYEAEVWEATLP